MEEGPFIGTNQAPGAERDRLTAWGGGLGGGQQRAGKAWTLSPGTAAIAEPGPPLDSILPTSQCLHEAVEEAPLLVDRPSSGKF